MHRNLIAFMCLNNVVRIDFGSSLRANKLKSNWIPLGTTIIQSKRGIFRIIPCVYTFFLWDLFKKYSYLHCNHAPILVLMIQYHILCPINKHQYRRKSTSLTGCVFLLWTLPRAKNCSPALNFYTSLRTGVALSSPCCCQKRPHLSVWSSLFTVRKTFF